MNRRCGVEGLLYYIAGCCSPIPGEAIIGVVTRSSQGSIHRQGVRTWNVEGDRLVPVSWNSTHTHRSSQTYPVNIQIEAIDRGGIKDILSRCDHSINVRNAQVKTFEGQPAVIELGKIRDRNQLEHLHAHQKMSDILNLRRLGQVEE